jgi:hypothetical protein
VHDLRIRKFVAKLFLCKQFIGPRHEKTTERSGQDISVSLAQFIIGPKYFAIHLPHRHETPSFSHTHFHEFERWQGASI